MKGEVMVEPRAEGHPVPDIERLIAGRASPGERRRAVRHLLAGCDACRARLVRPPADERELTLAIDRATGRLPELARRVARERAEAGELVARLRTLVPAQQRLILENAAGAEKRAVCELLLELARGQRHQDAQEAVRLAELAVLVAERVVAGGGGTAGDVVARAWAELGNARRIAGDPAAAERALDRAEKLAEERGADPLFEAELASLRASLESYRRNFRRAVQLVRRSTSLLRIYGDPVAVARSLIQLGDVHAKEGEPAAGLRAVEEALALLENTGHAELKLIAVHNLMTLALDAGAPWVAAAVYAEALPLHELVGARLDLLRFQWVGGRIAAELGEEDEAERRLLRVRDEFHREGLPYEAAQVALNLAALYARQGRRRELRELVTGALPAFRRLRIPRETIVSLSLLAGAEQAEALTLIAGVAAAVEDARERPPRSAAEPGPSGD
jgi:tetratricopeptide (TPR) repeat protein